MLELASIKLGDFISSQKLFFVNSSENFNEKLFLRFKSKLEFSEI